jgi:hypothetical protein
MMYAPLGICDGVGVFFHHYTAREASWRVSNVMIRPRKRPGIREETVEAGVKWQLSKRTGSTEIGRGRFF